MPSVKNKKKINRELPYGIGTYAIEASHKRWKPLKHLIICIELLLFLVQGRLNRLMIFMPPRHGKSELISQYFLSWYLGTFKDKRAILTSYGAGFAAKWGRLTRDLLKQYGTEMFLSDVLIKDDSQASHRWDIKGHKGGLITGGSGGPIMGEGANLFIFDDPHKNIEEARSPTYQEKAWEWYLNVALQRVERDLYDMVAGAMVYIAQRLDVNDLAGQILDAEPHIDAVEALEILRNGGSIPEGTWVVLNFPLVCEDSENDLLGREVGETIWNDRINSKEAQHLRNTMGEFRFNAVHQGEPREREGKYLTNDTLEIVETLPINLNQQIQWADLAWTYYPPEVPLKQRGAATAIVRIGLSHDRKLYITYFDEFWEESDTVMGNIIDSARSGGKQVKYCIPQDPGAGKGVVKSYSIQLPGYNFEGIIEPTNMDKEMRAEAPSNWGKVNKIYIYRNAPGPNMIAYHGSVDEAMKRFKTCLTSFPNHKHKDFMDALSGAFSALDIPEEEENVGFGIII